MQSCNGRNGDTNLVSRAKVLRSILNHIVAVPEILARCDGTTPLSCRPNWLTGACHRHQLHGRSHCNTQRHGTVSFTNIGIYAAMSHKLAPDNHPVAFSVPGFPDNRASVLRPACLEDQHRRSWFPLLLACHLSPGFCCRSQLWYYQDANARRIPYHRTRGDCRILRAHRTDVHDRHV